EGRRPHKNGRIMFFVDAIKGLAGETAEERRAADNQLQRERQAAERRDREARDEHEAEMRSQQEASRIEAGFNTAFSTVKPA
ncbi:hypothetical protein PENTCL1PPCAC_28606, partial [Pristionchus entomophagus]